jgi:hypothetical protein
MTSSEVLLGLSSGDLSSFLIDEGFLNLETNIDNLITRCCFTPDAEKVIRQYMPDMPGVIDANTIAGTYQEFFEMRRVAKKDLAAAQAKAKPLGTSVPAKASTELKKEQESLLANIGVLKGKAAAYAKEKQGYDNHISLVKNAESDVAAIDIQRPNEKQIEENRETLEKAIAELADKKSLFASLDKVADNYESTLGNLATSKCPISDMLVCNTDKTVVKAELEGLLKDVTEQMAKLEDQTEELQRIIAKRKLRDSEYRQQVKEYQKKLLATQRLEDLKKLNLAEPKEFDNTELISLESQNAKLVSEYQAAIAYETTQAAKEEVVVLTKKVEIYNNILEQLAPKSGIKQILIEQATQPLTEYMNEQIVKLLPDRAIHVDTDKGLEFMVADETDGIIGINALSTSEKLRVALIIQDMLNELSGFRILMIDNIDSFDNDTFKSVFDYITDESTLSRHDNIFIAGLPNAAIVKLVSAIGSTVELKEIYM